MASSFQWACRRFDQLSLHDLYEILRLRDTVFVMEQQSIYGDLDGLDYSGYHVTGHEQNGKLVAYARFLAPGIVYQEATCIGRVAVIAEKRGQGVGHQLVTRTLELALLSFPNNAMKLSAQTHTAPFYQSFGFSVASEPYSEGGIMHIDMYRLPPSTSCKANTMPSTQ